MLSCFTPTCLLELSSEPSAAETFYELLYGLRGGGKNPGLAFAEGSDDEAKLYAWAMGLARAYCELLHAGFQFRPSTVYDLLPLMERDFFLAPGPNDTVLDRQNVLVALWLLTRGAVPENYVAGLRAVFGLDFIALGQGYPDAVSGKFQSHAFPTNPVTGGFAHYADVRVPNRVVKLVDPITKAGLQWVAYEAIDGRNSSPELVKGEEVVVQGENDVLGERVTVVDATVTPPAGSNASPATPPEGTAPWADRTTYAAGRFVEPTAANATGLFYKCVQGGTTDNVEPAWPERIGQIVVDGTVVWVAFSAGFVFKATFLNGHDVGATVVAGDFPRWWSTQRLLIACCDEQIATRKALIPDYRKRASEFMRRVTRGVTQWAILDTPSNSSSALPGVLRVNDRMGNAMIVGSALSRSA